MNRIAYLLCEIKSRDLDTRLLIAAHLLNMGVAVAVGQRWGIGENRLVSPRGCYLFPTANHIQGGGMEQVRTAGHYVFASDEEAFAAVADTVHTEESLARTVSVFTSTAANAMENCHKMLACSDTHAELLSRQFPKQRKKIIVAGSPRVELLTNSRIQSPEKTSSYVLVNTSFPLVNSIWPDDTAVRSAREVFGEAATELRVKGQEAGMEMFRSVIQWLIKKHDVVIRPHPGENPSIWRDQFPEARVLTDSAPLAWIKGAKALIHGNSTTGLEAILMGVPTLNLNPISEYGEISIVGRISPCASTVEQTISILESFLETGIGLESNYAADDLFPPNGGLAIAKELSQEVIDKAPLSKEFSWSRTPRTELQRKKFTVSLNEIVDNPNIKSARRHGVIQLDDSIFLLNPM